ncbi:MAG TPA: hypothetical protein VN724_17770, partial [Pyrinomonadaceae bacterium]|nr:hypothetical protein [Pyrinomonadaceae bacterium]
RENQNSQKTGNEKSFVVIEKLVTRQIRARNFLTISPKVFFRQTLQGFMPFFCLIPGLANAFGVLSLPLGF